MAMFCLKDSSEHYLKLSEKPKKFDADSPVTNVFFDDTNGQVFTVRSGGVTGVTVIGMDNSKSTSFRMEDKGPIISIKFSPDHCILAIQRNCENQVASIEFMNFKQLIPTNIEYTHTCKWKNAKILGFVWSKVNEIAFITDHGIELLQVVPDKKQLKSLKSTSFSGAWFSWCPQSKIVLLAGNNGALLQPFSLNNSTISKLNKLELEFARAAERDVVPLRLRSAAWCAVFRHAPPGPTEVVLLPLTSPGPSHILRTGLTGRFALNVVDDLIIVHHQSSQTSLLFDIEEETTAESETAVHIPLLPGTSMRPAYLDDQPCPMYSGNWVVFQPDYMIDARLGCLWRVHLDLSGLVHAVPKEEIPKIVAVLLRRQNSKETVTQILHQMVTDASTCLVEISKVFDEINVVYRLWADEEIARNTAGGSGEVTGARGRLVLTQSDVSQVLMTHADDKYIVQVVTAYLASLSRHSMLVQQASASLVVRTTLTHRHHSRLNALIRRGCIADARPLACQLLSLGRLQLALDMLWRLKAHEEIVEVLLSCEEPVSGVGAAQLAGVWSRLPPRKVLAAAARAHPAAFVAVYHALLARNERLRGAPHFLKAEQCESYVELYKKVTSG